MTGSTPTLRLRHLSSELRRLRREAGVSADDAAAHLRCSKDRILWMERAEWKRPKWREISSLLDLYGVTDPGLRDELINIARSGGTAPWWSAYSRVLGKRYTAFIGLEASASTVLTFQPLVVPGLLQTDDYARAVIENGMPQFTTAEADDRVEVRIQRRRLLEGPQAVRLWAIIDEPVIRRSIGAEGIMRGQLQHLVEIAGKPNVTLQMVSYAAGAHPGLPGGFTILEFPEGARPAAYIESGGGDLLLEEPSDVDPYQEVFRRLQIKALDPADTLTLLSEAAANL